MASNLASDYSQTLKAIKAKEEESYQEITGKKKQLDSEIQKLQEDVTETLARARAEAEKYITEEVEKAKAIAQGEAEKLLEDKKKEAEKLASRKLSASEIRQIIDNVLLSEFMTQ